MLLEVANPQSVMPMFRGFNWRIALPVFDGLTKNDPAENRIFGFGLDITDSRTRGVSRTVVAGISIKQQLCRV